uniref:Sodium-dependent phosphate transporter n=1 Tax=Peronospora matthiolae TaxID=2874970 RepID=A0AAV1UGR3_9STRA
MVVDETSHDYERLATPVSELRPSAMLNDCHQKLDTDAEDEEEHYYSTMPLYKKTLWGIFYSFASVAALYFFMVAVKLIGDGITVALGCDTKGAFDFADNPVAGLMIGTIATALLHSSGTVTSIVVALVGSSGMTIRQGVFVIMGANIGTCVTCIMVAFGQVGDLVGCFQRAMAAATVHDMYNLWSVFVLFPLEWAFHPLEKLSVAMSNAHTDSGAFSSPVDVVVNPLAKEVIVVDKGAVYDVAAGAIECTSIQSFVTGGVFEGSSMGDGSIGAITALIGVCILVCSLFTLVKMLAKVFTGTTKHLVSKLLNYNGYINIIVGTLITFCVHSSTVVTSTITPLAGLGVITLEQVYPLVIGANLGTTGTALLAALVTGRSDSVAIALVHFWFNVFGIILFYPIPITRKPILSWARSLAFASAAWPMTAVLFLIFLFLVAPGILLGLVYMCTASSTAVQVIGYIIAAIVVVVTMASLFWYLQKGGRSLWHAFLEKKRLEREARTTRDTTRSCTQISLPSNAV